jgi:hypothetical protein
MKRIAWICSAIALCSAILAYSMSRWGFPAVGFESAVWLVAVLFWLGALAALVSTLLCIVTFLRTRSPVVWPLLCAVVAGLALVAVARS